MTSLDDKLLMNEHKVKTVQVINLEDQKRRLARAYALILSWPEPPKEKTTGSEDFAETPEPVEGTPAEDADAL